MARTETTPLETAELTGTPLERGITHGERFGDGIETNVEIYRTRFASLGADEGTVREQARQFSSFIEDVDEEYFREMEGISRGSDVPLEDVAMLNARWEVMYSALADSADGREGVDGCTGFGVQPDATADGHTYIGQNWDWIPSLEIFVMDVRRDDGPDMVAMTEAGIVGGKIGVNEHGIGVTVNGLISESDGDRPYRKPMHVRLREVLDADRFDRAIAPLVSPDRPISANVILGHADGEVLDFELTPERYFHYYPEDGILTHANHFETTDVESTFETILPDTLCRAPRLERLLSRERGAIDDATLGEALADHFGKPASICRHVDDDRRTEEQYRTNGSFVLDLTERSMLATRGPPCQTAYHRFDVAT